jgi:hypothetical protein
MKRLVAAAALLYSALHFAMAGVRQPLANFYGDFLAAFPSWTLAARFGRLDFFRGQLAERWAGYFGHEHSWHYGPLLHFVTIPLFAFPTLRSAYVAWLFVNYAIVAAAAVVAMFVVDRGRPAATTIVVVLVLFANFNPLYEALTERVIELSELLLLFAAFAWLQRGRDAASGASVGAAAMMKFLPLIFVPHFVLKRRWRGVAGASAIVGVVAVATQLVLGWQHSGIFYQLAGGAIVSSELDQSLPGFLRRVFDWLHWPAVATVSRVAILAGLAALCLFMLYVRRCQGTDDLEWSVLAVAMILFLPHNQQYYLTFLLFPYLMLYARYRERWTWRALPAAVSLLLVAAPVPFSVFGPDAFPRYLRAGIPFVGAVLLAAVLVRELSACRMQFERVSSHVPRRDILESQRLSQ